MNNKSKIWIITTLILIVIIASATFLIPKQMHNVLNDNDILFEEVTITKMYFDKDLGGQRFADYIITDSEDISQIRSLLSDITVTPTFKRKDYPGGLYEFTFRSLETGHRMSFGIIAKSYVYIFKENTKHYKVYNKEGANKIIDFTEALIEGLNVQKTN